MKNGKKEIYIAGPMTGYPEFNFPAFFAAAKKLEAEGWHVHNPANKSEEEGVVENDSYGEGDAAGLIASGWDFRKAYIWDLTAVIKSDAIYLLKGWENSPGAVGEYTIAKVIQKRYPKYEIWYE